MNGTIKDIGRATEMIKVFIYLDVEFYHLKYQGDEELPLNTNTTKYSPLKVVVHFVFDCHLHVGNRS